MSTSNETVVVIATYNEIDALPQLVDEILRSYSTCDVLVIDDSSPDGTADWAESRAAQDHRVSCLRRPHKLGLGTAVLAGIRHAIEQDYRYLVNMDGDFSHHPRYSSAIVGRVAHDDMTDVAVGSRYIRGGKIDGWPLYRRVMSRVVNGFARFWLGLPTRDCSGSYRCYRVAALKKLNLDQFRSRGYSFFEEVLFRLRRAGAGMAEVPIAFTGRKTGSTKLSLLESIRAIATIALIRIGP